MKYFVTFILLCLSSFHVYGQSNTISLREGATSPKAELNDLTWIYGHWKGEAFGGITEVVWAPPSGGSMMAVFKLVTDNQVNFYEIITITEEHGTLMKRLKHFHPDLKGWEEKDQTIDFPLVSIQGDHIFFDDFTYEKISEDEMNIYVIIGRKDALEEVKFNYKRVQ